MTALIYSTDCFNEPLDREYADKLAKYNPRELPQVWILQERYMVNELWKDHKVADEIPMGCTETLIDISPEDIVKLPELLGQPCILSAPSKEYFYGDHIFPDIKIEIYDDYRE